LVEKRGGESRPKKKTSEKSGGGEVVNQTSWRNYGLGKGVVCFFKGKRRKEPRSSINSNGDAKKTGAPGHGEEIKVASKKKGVKGGKESVGKRVKKINQWEKSKKGGQVGGFWPTARMSRKKRKKKGKKGPGPKKCGEEDWGQGMVTRVHKTKPGQREYALCGESEKKKK